MITAQPYRPLKHATDRSPKGRTLIDTYFSEIDRTSLLSAEEERELGYRIQSGDTEARDHMVRANLRLVVAIARKYAHASMCFEDIIAEGNLGLLRAVEAFDPSRNTRFSTYARFWITQAIRRAIQSSSKTIRVPCYLGHLLSSWQRTRLRLFTQLGRMPTDDEVGKQLGLSERKSTAIRLALSTFQSTSLTEEREDNGNMVGDSLADSRTPPPDDMLLMEEQAHQIHWMLGRLKQRDAQMVRMRYGLDGQRPQTFQEISERYGVTRERIRQIIRKALRKLQQAWPHD